MAQPVMQVGVALLVLLFGVVGARAVLRRRFDSALLHVGCACVLAGWLMGRHAVRNASPDRPCLGSMVMVDGEESDRLWEGPMLDRSVGRLPFSVRLERFLLSVTRATAMTAMPAVTRRFGNTAAASRSRSRGGRLMWPTCA